MLTYNLDLPIRTQDHDWDCAQESTLWGVTVAGRHPSNAWMEAQMLADGIESTELGLLDGSGSDLAAWITEQYSDGSPTLHARNASPVTFDEVRSVAGTAPVLVGGHHWGAAGHWVGVRGYDAASDVLVLANPGGTGPMYGQQTLSRRQFADFGWFSMVMITANGAVIEPLPPEPSPSTGVTRSDLQAIYDQIGALLERMPV